MIVPHQDPAKTFDGVFVGAIRLMGWSTEHVSDVVGPFRAVRRRDPEDPVTGELADLMIEDLQNYTKAFEDGLFERDALARHRLGLAAAELGNAIADRIARDSEGVN